ncbi:MAG TPA: BON domain-containing protein [Anaerolineales bacterium]
MLATQIPRINPDEFSKCEERSQMTDHGKSLSPIQKTDTAIKGFIDRAIWKDDVLRAIEYYEIEVHVKSGIVYLYGHIVGTTSQNRIQTAIRAIPGILGIQNNLVLDDKLTLEVAASLGELEHTYECKFFTGASHGVISLNGNVGDENVKLLAEQRAASNPNVRGVINNVRVSGAEQELQDQPFLQPTIGEIIYFLDGVSGAVKQVIINPNNRRVTAMIIEGKFADRHDELNLLTDGKARPSEHLVVVPMNEVRYLTKVSGFLYINSNERNRYMEFNPTRFFAPKNDWQAPYPYCPDDVLFPIEQREVEYQILEQLPRPPFVVALQEQALWEQLLANDSLGG